MTKPKTGDVVKVTTKDSTYEGILMPRPEMLGMDITVIKLDHGYNIGVFNKDIKDISLVASYKPKPVEAHKLKLNPKLPTVSILSTGGTISSRIDYRTGGVYADYTAEDFVIMCPELEKIANVKAKKVMTIMSEDMDSNDWKNIAKVIASEIKSGVDGVVVTQGTDTLHFTTAAMSFMLSGLNKPVIFTASQRSIDRGSTDAFMNLISSVKAAAEFDGAVVATCMHGTTNDDYCILVRGTKVRKMHTSRRDAFRPINEKELARVYSHKDIEIINDNYPKVDKKNKTNLRLVDSFQPKTAFIQVYPGMDPGVIDFYIDKGYKGLVISATALGHVPTNHPKDSIIPQLKKAVKKNIPVIVVSQTLYGRTSPYVYTNLRKLSVDVGCIFAEDMLPEVAYIKLGWILGQTKDLKKVKELMLTNIAGEINYRHMPDDFLR